MPFAFCHLLFDLWFFGLCLVGRHPRRRRARELPQSHRVVPHIDPGGTSITSLHFTLRGYTENDLRPLSVTAENLYNKIGTDTGLYSFLASGSYLIVVYRDRSEYLEKTRQPEWSRAVAVSSGIYTYPGPDVQPMLAHELTHLIFNAYLGPRMREFRWINEGLAMYEELAQMNASDRSAFQTSQQKQLRQNRMSFSQMSFFVPATEEQRRVDLWYQQVESVVAFMLAQGSALNFANMLNELRTGVDIDRAIANNYPGRFQSLAELENSWRYSL